MNDRESSSITPVASSHLVAQMHSPRPDTVAPEATAKEEPTAAHIPAAASQDSPPPLRARLRRLWPYFSGHTRLALVVVLALIASACTEPAIPAFVKYLLDKGFNSKSIELWVVPAIFISIALVRGLSMFLGDTALAKITQEGMQSLRRDMFARLMDARMALFTRESSSSLSNMLVYEVQANCPQMIGALQTGISNSLTVIALMAYLLYENWQLTLIMLAVFPVVGWITRTMSQRLHRLAKMSQGTTDELAYVVEENVMANRVVRLHSAQQQQIKRFERVSDSLKRLAVKSTAASSAISPLSHLLISIALSGVICIALWQAQRGMTVGGFVGFIGAMLALVSPVKSLSSVVGGLTRSLTTLERALDLIDLAPAETSGHFVSPRASGEIAFESVTVRYPEAAQPALHNFNLRIHQGEIVAFVGPSGSGKTTLMNLLPRFLDVTAGRITLDGQDITHWQIKSLRDQIAMVSQDVVMFNDSLAFNVALGQNINRERVLECLKAANLSDLLAGLPQGIDSPTGHNAIELSGGQRQRLAIARALYKNAPILILDEATSALDSASERLIQEALTRLMRGRTTLIVAHRLATIEHANRVAVLDHGQLFELGTHSELMSKKGLYARLHNLQFGHEQTHPT